MTNKSKGIKDKIKVLDDIQSQAVQSSVLAGVKYGNVSGLALKGELFNQSVLNSDSVTLTEPDGRSCESVCVRGNCSWF